MPYFYPLRGIEEEEEEEEEEEGRRRRRRHRKSRVLYSYHRHHGQQQETLDAASRKSGGKSVERIARSTLGTFSSRPRIELRFGVSSVGAPGTERHEERDGTGETRELYETYATPGDFSGKLERTLLAMYWLAPFTVGVAYIAGRNDVAMVYSTFLTMLLALVMQCRMMLSPIAFVLTIVAPVDLGGLLVKYKLLRDDTAGTVIPFKERRFLWNVRSPPKRSALCVAGNAMLRVRVDVYRVVVRSSRNSVSGIRPDLGLRDVALEDVAFSPRRDLDRCGRWLSSREEKHSVGNVFEQSDRVLLRDYGDFRGDFPLRFSPNFRRAACAFSRIRSRMCWVRVVFISLFIILRVHKIKFSEKLYTLYTNIRWHATRVHVRIRLQQSFVSLFDSRRHRIQVTMKISQSVALFVSIQHVCDVSSNVHFFLRKLRERPSCCHSLRALCHIWKCINHVLFGNVNFRLRSRLPHQKWSIRCTQL